jgi:hypothetical protein
MAKKKRSRRSAKQRQRQAARQAAIAQTTRSAKPSRSSLAETFREEYRYVVSDLRRMGILAAAMFVLMVVLAVVVG